MICAFSIHSQFLPRELGTSGLERVEWDETAVEAIRTTEMGASKIHRDANLETQPFLLASLQIISLDASESDDSRLTFSFVDL